MFKVGDVVIAGNDGICRIEKETWENWSGEERCYYLLVPNDAAETSGVKIYIPVENADCRLGKVMTKDEAAEFLETIEMISPMHIENERFCEKEYKDMLYRGEQKDRVALLKTLYQRIDRRVSSGKKPTAVDEKYCKLAENMLYSELSYALEQDAAELKRMIKKSIF